MFQLPKLPQLPEFPKMPEAPKMPSLEGLQPAIDTTGKLINFAVHHPFLFVGEVLGTFMFAYFIVSILIHVVSDASKRVSAYACTMATRAVKFACDNITPTKLYAMLRNTLTKRKEEEQ